MLELISPSLKYKDSFIASVKEFIKAEDRFFGGLKEYQAFDFERLNDDFYNYYIKPSEDDKNGINLKLGYVPSSALWLVDGSEVIGRTNVRHALTESLNNIGGNIGYAVRPSKRGQGYAGVILRLALKYAYEEIGIKEALVTADYRNEPSVRTIVKAVKEYGGKIAPPYIKFDNNLEVRFFINTVKG